jgi:hypothetical protein
MVIGFKIATALGLALWIYPHFGVDGLLPKFAPLSHRQTRIHYPVASTLSSAHSYGRRGSALRAVDSIDGSADVAVGSILSQNNGTHTVASVQEQLKLFGAMSKPFFVEEVRSCYSSSLIPANSFFLNLAKKNSLTRLVVLV